MGEMAENIEIKVQDQVSSSISTKLKAIASDARDGHSAVTTLQNALASLNSGALSTITQNANAATRAISQNALASQRLATEQQKTATAANQAATAQQNLATATVRTGTAQAQAATAAQRLATEQQRTAVQTAQAAAAQDRAAVAAIRLQQAQARAAQAAGQMDREAEALKRSLYPLYEAQQQHNDSVQRALALYKSGAISVKTYTDAVNRSATQLETATMRNNAFASGIDKTGKSAQVNRHHLTNLGFQIQDIGVSLASGQNPLTVFIQQGAQIGGIASQAGVGLGRMALEGAKMLARFIPIAAVLAAVVGGLKLFNTEVESQAGLKAYSESLGLTAREMKKLEDVSITFGDTFKGLWKTISEATGAGEFFSQLGDSALKAFKNIIGYATLAVQSLVAMFRAAFAVVNELWARFPVSFKKPIAEAINAATGYFEDFVNFALQGINKIIDGLNLVSAVKIDPLEAVKFDRIDTNFAESNGKSLADTFVSAYTSELTNLKKSTSKFMEDWQNNTAQSARDRIKKQATDIISDRIPKEEKAATKEMERLEKALARVRGEVSPSDEALRKLAQAQDILNRSVKAGLIDQAESERVMGRLRQKYQDQLDPIGALNRELKQEYDLLKLLPEVRETEQRMMQIENQFREKNIDLTKEQTAAIREQLLAIQERTRVAQAEQQLLSAVEGRKNFGASLEAMNNLKKNPQSGFTSGDASQAIIGANSDLDFSNTDTMFEANAAKYEDMYSRIDQLRQQDLINEQTAATLKQRVWLDQQNQQLNQAGSFFGQLSQLQKSENSKMAAVGKAAAIAQAMINTYQSATAAYSSMASIPYVGPALGAAAAAAAIAAGLANVQQIRSQNTAGFMSGGYTGNMATNEVAGVVHGKEYVMDASTTNRIGVDNLAALQSGAASVQRNGDNVGTAGGQQQAPTPQVNVTTPITAVVVQSQEAALAAMKSAEGKAFVIEAIEENGGTVARIIGAK
ncbi:hypothetical protein [Pseudomonas phage KP1]|uniref:Bacteriophage tail tape measure N-terminal domain-containing protein n=1 Tax=Pseudomonas phage KP1 TaxID=2562463 RepID=A0A6G5QAJ1_9CAUD|nr:tail length tape measure protein [Pseudomonas phage KP1]QBZ71756.1 hypothetical protein [Pseudomonas phage KP1]